MDHGKDGRHTVPGEDIKEWTGPAPGRFKKFIS